MSMTAELIPDTSAIRADLEFMTRRWSELPRAAMFELRAFAEGTAPEWCQFTTKRIAEAVAWAREQNERGRNVYAVRNPIDINHRGPATDEAILAAFYCWADCDTPDATSNVRRFEGPRWAAAVTTGRIPDTRVHLYWELAEPAGNLRAWRQLQVSIAAHFNSDPVVINPSRIMRVGGTVSFPAGNKRERGYVPEVCVLRTHYEDPREPVEFDRLMRVFGASAAPAAAAPSPGAPYIDTGDHHRTADEYAELLRRAQTDGEKHSGVRDLAASLAGQGVKRELAEAIIRAACPVWDANVVNLIGSAYAKYWREPAAFTPNFDHAPAPTSSDPAPQADGWRIQRADEFVADFVAPEYLIDGVVQRGRIYTLTAPTGSGKTAAMLYAAAAVGMGMDFCGLDVEAGDVLFLAGENPDDVRARVIATLEYYHIDPARCRLHFIAGTFSIRQDMERMRAEAARLPELNLVVVDTFAAYFDGDDENSNAQALDFARVVRRITAMPSKPAVIMPAHPVKNATRTNLAPKGGSSLVNEVDGNLTLWNDDGVLTLHWQVKHRGPDFEPLRMELLRYECERVHDRNGRIMPTVLAKPINDIRAKELVVSKLSTEDRILLNIAAHPALSLVERCMAVGLMGAAGAKKSSMAKLLQRLSEQKLIKRFRTNWELTKDGEKAVEMIRAGLPIAPEEA
jgi:hypothetical protein